MHYDEQFRNTLEAWRDQLREKKPTAKQIKYFIRSGVDYTYHQQVMFDPTEEELKHIIISFSEIPGARFEIYTPNNEIKAALFQSDRPSELIIEKDLSSSDVMYTIASKFKDIFEIHYESF